MKRHIETFLYSLAILSLLGAAAQGYALYRLESLQSAMAHPDTLRVEADTPAPLVFAKAAWHDRNGRAEEAMKLYSGLRATEDSQLRARVFHNLGALYLRDGAARWNARGVLDYARVLTLVELAKESYREALRLDPEDWDARHDLEYAWRITPPPKEKPKADFQGRKASIFATLPGIPGGGP